MSAHVYRVHIEYAHGTARDLGHFDSRAAAEKCRLSALQNCAGPNVEDVVITPILVKH